MVEEEDGVGTQGVRAVHDMLRSISEVMRSLVTGLAKRVDGADGCFSLVDHEKKRLKVLEQLLIDEDDLTEQDGEGESDEDAEMGNDDEASDATPFKEAFDKYKEARDRVRQLLEQAKTLGTNKDEKDSPAPEEVEKLHALRQEAFQKNQKIKELIDRLRYLRQQI